MQDKLLQYGFDTEQVEQLLKGKKLKTVHGEYALKDNVLELKRDADKSIKRVDLG